MSKIIVFAYSEPGYYGLKALIAQGADIAAVYTHQDDPDEEIWFPSVYELAKKHQLPVFRPEKITSQIAEEIIDLKPDLIYSIYFRRLIPMEILNSAPLGAYNLHGALLPKYRGQTCINWAVVNGETKTGATLHKMTKAADAGDIVEQRSITIAPLETAIEVFHDISRITYDIIASSYLPLTTNTAKLQPQDDSQATTFPRRRPKDGEIHWSDSTAKIFNLIRGVTHPFPGAFTTINGERLLIWWALPSPMQPITKVPGTVLCTDPVIIQTGDGCLELKSVQLEGEKEVEATTSGLFKVGTVLE